MDKDNVNEQERLNPLSQGLHNVVQYNQTWENIIQVQQFLKQNLNR